METENEKQIQEAAVENSGEQKNAAVKAKEFFAKFGTCGEVCQTIWKENKKNIIILLVVVLLIVGGFGFKKYQKKNDVGPIAVKAAVQKFIDENSQPGTKAEISDPVKESGLYKLTLKVGSTTLESYVTLDGKKLFYQPVDLTQKVEPAQPADEKKEAENKADVPEVDLYVMSYCPYGLQMERGILPAVETLGKKIKFNLKFVDYTLHGQKEVDENLNQYCIQKVQPTKLDDYLKCFWKKSTGESEACMKSTGIVASQVKSCLADAKKKFNPSEKIMGLNKEDAAKYNVSGSPTLIINGTKVASSRDSQSVLKAICSGFKNKPAECDKKLSSEAPAPGFDDQASGSGASSGASCGE